MQPPSLESQGSTGPVCPTSVCAPLPILHSCSVSLKWHSNLQRSHLLTPCRAWSPPHTSAHISTNLGICSLTWQSLYCFLRAPVPQGFLAEVPSLG